MLPMAFECSALMKSLVAWASSHLATRDATLQHTALEHRGSALKALKASIDDSELSSEMCLAIAMVFCSMDSISDTTGSWYQHLLGGAAALGQSGGDPSSSGPSNHISVYSQLSRIEGGWLLRNFAYHDALMSVTLDCRPLITGHYWATTDSAWVDPYFGLASRIIYLISQISVMCANLNQSAGLSVIVPERTFAAYGSSLAEADIPTYYQFPWSLSEPSTFDDAYDIETELLSWHCPDGFAGSPLGLLAEAYRSAALLHLYRTLRRHGADINGQLKNKISQQVGSICDLVAQMPDGCLEECTLLFPLFIAGGEAVSSTHIEIICNKMEIINQYRHFRNVNQALEVLNDLWRLRCAGASGTNNRELDWLDITKSRNIKLAIT